MYKKLAFLLLLLGLFSSVSMAAPCTGELIAWYEFEDDLTDSAGGDNNGTEIGTISYSTDSQVGRKSAYFEGTSTYITLAGESDFDFTNAMTVGGWFKRDGSWPSFGTCYVTKGAQAWQLVRRWNQNYSAFGVAGSVTGAGTSMEDDAWHHIVGVFDGSEGTGTLRIYVDGTLDATSTLGVSYGGVINTTDDVVTIGSNIDYPGQLFKGWMDDIGIANVAISSADVMQLYQGTANWGMLNWNWWWDKCFDRDHPDCTEWQAVGEPNCWCYEWQCYGDADGYNNGSIFTGRTRVRIEDLNVLFNGGWEDPNDPCDLPVYNAPSGPIPGICADFDRKQNGSPFTGYYRLAIEDLNLLFRNWERDDRLNETPVVGSPEIADPNWCGGTLDNGDL